MSGISCPSALYSEIWESASSADISVSMSAITSCIIARVSPRSAIAPNRSGAYSRKRFSANRWNVPTRMGTSSSPPEDNATIRSHISVAARLVNVTAMTEAGDTPQFWIRSMTRWVSTRVFPVPGPAVTMPGPLSIVTAACWWGSWKGLGAGDWGLGVADRCLLTAWGLGAGGSAAGM